MEQDIKPRNKPMHLWYLNFDTGGKNMQWGEERLSNNWCRENLAAMCKRMKSETPYSKISSKWIEDLHVRPEDVKLIEENRPNTQ